MKRPPLPVFYISTAASLSTLGDAVLYAILPSYYPHLGLAPFQVGIILSVNRWIRLGTNHMAEHCYRCYPNVPWLIFAFLMGSVVTAVYGIAGTFIIFLGARIFWGVSVSFTRQTSIMTAVESGSEVYLGERMGYYRGISAMWVALGLILGGLSHDAFGFTPTLIALSILSLFAIPLGVLSQQRLKQLKKPPAEDIAGKWDLGVMLCGFVIGTVGAGIVMSTLGLILKERIGESFGIAGYSIGVVALTSIMLGLYRLIRGIMSPIFGNIADRIGRERPIPFLFLFGAIALSISGICIDPILLVVLMVVFFICGITLDTLLFAQAAQSGPRSIASFVTAVDLGMSIGPLIGWSIPHFGFPINYILVSGGAIYMIGAIVALKKFGILGELNKQ